MKKLAIAVLMMLPIPAFGQAAYSNNVTTVAKNVPPGAQAPVYSVPNAQIFVCTSVSGQTCSGFATLFQDIALTQPLTQPIIANGQGNYSFYAATGTYTIVVNNSAGTFLGTYPVTLGASGGSGSPLPSGTGIIGVQGSSTGVILTPSQVGAIAASATNGWTINLAGQTAYTEGSSLERCPHAGGSPTGSILAGGGCVASYPNVLLTSPWGTGHFSHIYNDAVDGSTSTQMNVRYGSGSTNYGITVPSAHSVSPAVTGSANRGIFFLGMSPAFNDYNAGITVSQSIANFTGEVAAAHADGYYVVLMTAPTVMLNNGPGSEQVLTLNRVATSNNTFGADIIFQGDQVITDVTDADYYDVDNIHLTVNGDAQLGAALTNFMISGGTQTIRVPGYFTNQIYSEHGLLATENQSTPCITFSALQVNCSGAATTLSYANDFNVYSLADSAQSVAIQKNTLHGQALYFGVSDATHSSSIQSAQVAVGNNALNLNLAGGPIYSATGGGSGFGTLNDGNGGIHMNAAQFTSIGGTSFAIPSMATGCAQWTTGGILGSTGAACGSGGGGGSGTVTTFTAPAGSWPAWLVPTVTNPTTTPNLAVAASAIPNSALANASTTVNGQPCTLGGTCTITTTSGFPIVVGSTSIAAGSTTTTLAGVTLDGVSPTTFGYVDATSSIQTQLNAKGSGSVTSVALTLPSIFTVTGSPVTASGTLTATLASQSANTFFAAPNGSAGAPTFRAIVAADVPQLNQPTTSTAANLSGTPALPNGTTVTTQTAGDSSTKIASDAFVAAAAATASATPTGAGCGSTGSYVTGTGACNTATALGSTGGQIPITPTGGGVPYVPQTMSGDCTLQASGIITCTPNNSEIIAGANTATAAFSYLAPFTFGYASLPSTSVIMLSGALDTTGTVSTNLPQLLIQPSASTAATWNTNGGGLGINLPTSTSTAIDVKNNGTESFNVTSNGNVAATGTGSFGGVLTVTGAINGSSGLTVANGATASQFNFASKTRFLGPTDGIAEFTNNASGALTQMVFGPIAAASASLCFTGTESFASWGSSGCTVHEVLGASYHASILGAAQPSAATITPSGGIFHVTGTTAISTMTFPTTIQTTEGTTITLIADGAWSLVAGTTAGQFKAALTAVAGTPYACTYDGTLWYCK